MEMVSIETKICPNCGWDQVYGSQHHGALPLGAKLHDGRYLIGRELGRGGFGITYIGFDSTLQMKVAVKEYCLASVASRVENGTSLRWNCSDEELREGKESFIKEARNMALINRISNVAQVKDVFFQNQTAYIVMNYIEGQTLYAYLKQHGVMSEQEALSFFLPILEAVSGAHREGVLHRDISPDNIMIDRDQKIWLMDLGAAKAFDAHQTMSGVKNSTRMIIRHGFSPIEQYAESAKLGTWSDVYALSATIYFALTGSALPDSLSRMEDDSIVFQDSISMEMRNLLKNGLTIRADERIQTIDEFIKIWNRIPREPPQPKRNKVLIPLFVFVFMIICWGIHHSIMLKPIIGRVGDVEVIAGTEGMDEGHDCLKLFDTTQDGSIVTNTAWRVEFQDKAFVQWKLLEPISVTQIELVTTSYCENSDSRLRNPKSWSLYGWTADKLERVQLKTVSSDYAMKDVNNKGYVYPIEAHEEMFQCFELVVTETQGSDILEFSGIEIR